MPRAEAITMGEKIPAAKTSPWEEPIQGILEKGLSEAQFKVS
jgi:hypothetical protein